MHRFECVCVCRMARKVLCKGLLKNSSETVSGSPLRQEAVDREFWPWLMEGGFEAKVDANSKEFLLRGLHTVLAEDSYCGLGS